MAGVVTRKRDESVNIANNKEECALNKLFCVECTHAFKDCTNFLIDACRSHKKVYYVGQTPNMGIGVFAKYKIFLRNRPIMELTGTAILGNFIGQFTYSKTKVGVRANVRYDTYPAINNRYVMI
jgi:hypothetical protein